MLREAAVFANLDSLSPPVVTTLEPGRDLAYPACRRDETNMVFIRWAPRRTLPGPQDIGWTYADALDLHTAPPPCRPAAHAPSGAQQLRTAGGTSAGRSPSCRARSSPAAADRAVASCNLRRVAGAQRAMNLAGSLR